MGASGPNGLRRHGLPELEAWRLEASRGVCSRSRRPAGPRGVLEPGASQEAHPDRRAPPRPDKGAEWDAAALPLARPTRIPYTAPYAVARMAGWAPRALSSHLRAGYRVGTVKSPYISRSGPALEASG